MTPPISLDSVVGVALAIRSGVYSADLSMRVGRSKLVSNIFSYLKVPEIVNHEYSYYVHS